MRTALAIVLMLAATPGYRESVEAWRADHEAELRTEDGWLSLTGLFWLTEGENTAGSAAESRVHLPHGFPRHAGMFVRSGRVVKWRPARGAARTLRSDKEGEPDVIRIGRLRLHVIERGTKLGVRMRDSESPSRRSFKGLTWFPVTEEWNVKAKFISNPRTMIFDAQAGDRQEMSSPGYVEWTWRGQALRLTPVIEEKELFFVFKDLTAGKSTYAAARFLYANLPRNGYVQLDFNKAYNPPCVFTPYATCPLPPRENRLPVSVEAGEKMYTAHQGSRLWRE